MAALDLWSKWLAFERIEPGEQMELISGFLFFSLSRNHGGVFGVLQGQVAFFTAFSLLALLFILWMFWAHGGASRLLTFGLGLVLGGAVGNLYDRIALRFVRDFIDVRLWGWRYPTFNIADSGICVGVAILMALSLFWGPERWGEAGRQEGVEDKG